MNTRSYLFHCLVRAPVLFCAFSGLGMLLSIPALGLAPGDRGEVNSSYSNSDSENVLPESTTVSNINASLAMEATINGTVTGPDGMTPIENIRVDSRGPGWNWGPSTYTDVNGQYTLGGLAAGTYRVSFRDDAGTYVSEVYDNIPGSDFWNTGMDISVPESGTVSNINATLLIAAKITGTVTGPDGMTPLPNIRVDSHGPGRNWGPSTYTDANGQYTVGGLAAGTYRVSFRDDAGTYVSEVYDNIPGSDVWNTGMDIVVPESGTVSNINALLSVASTITGMVTGPGGLTPLADSYVYAYTWNGSWWNQVSYDYTDASGRYEVGGLATGTYRIEFYNWNGNYVSEVYSNAPSLNSGTDIVVPLAATVSNINASLDQYASLGGTVTRADGITPLSGVRVGLVGTVDGITHSAVTDANGDYLLTYLRPGDCSIRTEPTANSGYLGQWYTGILYVPGQDTPPPAVTVVPLGSGEAATNINFALALAGRITGAVTGNGSITLVGGRVKARNGTYGLAYEGQTDASGMYELRGLMPGNYTIKAGAALFKDEWWSDAIHEDLASAFPVTSGDDLSIDFDLEPGQSPALVEVTSDPSGASIYLDYQATTNITPAVLAMGEIGDWEWTACRVASRVITVKKAGRPRPVPISVTAQEAETVNVHFDMTSSASGSVSIATTPDGTAVFVDYADSADGISPVTVGNLALGSHVILLKQTGYLQPHPVIVQVQEELTTAVTLPMTTDTAPDRIIANVRSVPPGSTIYVDYLPSTNVTDAIVDWMDPASHAGSGWCSASHTIMLRKNGFLPAAPRYVFDATNEPNMMMVNFTGDAVTAVDADDDRLPDQWEDAYRLRELAPGKNGAQDDPDEDGSTNEQEMRAGTNPLDGNSRLAVGELTASAPGQGQTITVIFATVPGRTYIVQWSDELKNAWTNFSGLIMATDYQFAYTTQLPEGTVPRFYRLIILTP